MVVYGGGGGGQPSGGGTVKRNETLESFGTFPWIFGSQFLPHHTEVRKSGIGGSDEQGWDLGSQGSLGW